MLLSYGSDQPTIGREAFVAANATILGKVTIGEKSSIWYGAVVRGDVGTIRIGDRTNIQDLCVVHVTTGEYDTRIGDDVTVGHRAILHGCTIESGSLIGMGATILDGAVVGEGTLIGAGALITPRTQIPPGSLVLGTPGRVVRSLEEDEKRKIAESALHYVSMANRHRVSVTTV